jgi:hypothetical protein
MYMYCLPLRNAWHGHSKAVRPQTLCIDARERRSYAAYPNIKRPFTQVDIRKTQSYEL